MLIVVELDRTALRGWHVALLEAMDRRIETKVQVRWSRSSGRGLPLAVEKVLGLERLLHRIPRDLIAPVSSDAFASRLGSEPVAADVVVDLVGLCDEPRSRILRLTFDGAFGDEAALAALFDDQMPVVEVTDVRSGQTVASGRPGSETPGVIAAAYHDVLATTIEIVLSALLGRSVSGPLVTTPRPLRSSAVAKYAVRSLSWTAVHRLYQLLYRSPHWRVGWRFVDGPDVIDLLDHPATGWQRLADDGFHFYADPFPIVVDGTSYLFVEDFDHRVGRGVISVVRVNEHGPVGTPLAVLEHDVHMSYPFVLEDEGQVWMIPETSSAGTVELYRAAEFPDRWTQEEILLDGIEASDATVFQHQGRWWMTATVRTGGSFSDALHLWSAPRLRGPWTPHEKNPVLVDIAAARPAGRVVERNGRLIRPAQDGRSGYGAALTLAEITQLDDDGFAQRTLGTVTPGPNWPGSRFHTLNRAGRLECIDGSARSPRVSLRNRTVEEQDPPP